MFGGRSWDILLLLLPRPRIQPLLWVAGGSRHHVMVAPGPHAMVAPGPHAMVAPGTMPWCLQVEDEHHHAVHAFISCSWIHNMLIPESITGISCFMFRPKPSQRLPTLHGRALHGFHFHHHVSPGLIPCNYGKNHAVHGTCHGSAWFLCQTQKKVKSWRVIKSFSL